MSDKPGTLSCDPIKRPAHYVEGRKFQPISVIQDWQLDYELGCALKYIARAGRKEDAEEDIEKAKVYLGFFLDRIRLEKVKVAEETGRALDEVLEEVESQPEGSWTPPWNRAPSFYVCEHCSSEVPSGLMCGCTLIAKISNE